MTAAKGGYRRFLKDLTEYMADHGFVANRRIFRCANGHGDMVIVEVQISSSSLPESVEFYVNLGLVLAPRWQWDRERMNLAESEEPTSSSGLWFGRVAPPGQGGTWRRKISDDDAAIAVLNEVRCYLDQELLTWKRFLDRDMLLQAASEQDGVFSGSRAWQIRAWLLADQPHNERIVEEILQHAGISASHAVYGPILEHAARTTTAHRTETM